MTRKYFGTDGIRGRVGEAPITPDFCLRLGWAAGRVFARNGRRLILIGKDTRISDYMFESVLEAGLSSAGVDVRLLGPMPTPAVAYLTRTLRADAGIVISASHNPFYDNGIKFFDCDGNKLAGRKGTRDRSGARFTADVRDIRSHRQSEAGRGRARSLHRILQGDRRSRHAAERLQDRARLRKRRDLRRGAGRFRGTGCRYHRDRGGPRRTEHQCRLRLDASGTACRTRYSPAVQISVSRSMATAIAC